VLSLTLKDAVDRGLRYNLSISLGQQGIRAAQSARLRALSGLLPHIAMETSEVVQQMNLASVGISGLSNIPQVVGPFSVFDVRARLSQSLDFSKISEIRAGTENVHASEHSYQNTRDQVALVCLQLYMQAAAGNSRVEASQAQLKTAKALYDLALSRRSAGLIPGIEVLRSQVQMQAQQQRLILAENDFAKFKLSLAQAIGLPMGQEFELADRVTYTPTAPISLEDALKDAYRNRGDYQSLQSQVKATEEARKAAVRKRLPNLDLDANYGDIGQRPFMSHGTFFLGLSLHIPIFQGRETESRILAADAQLEQQKADLESLRARIYYEIRSALLDLQSSGDRVLVAKSNLDLAGEQVGQAQDRFAAGVVSNIEVVLAQDTLALATEDYIASLYGHSFAKVSLAQAMGMAANGYEKLLTGK
jgi:outer membrane protein TolC